MVGLNQRSLLSLLQRTPSSGDYVAASKKKWAASAVLFQIRKRTAKKPYLSGGLRELQQSLLILARSSYVCQQTSSRCPWPPLCLNQRLGSLWVASAISREPTLSFYAAAIIKKKNYVFTKIRSFSKASLSAKLWGIGKEKRMLLLKLFQQMPKPAELWKRKNGRS